MATYSSILAWEIPWTEEPGGLQSLGSQKSQTWLNTKPQSTRMLWASKGNMWLLTLLILSQERRIKEVQGPQWLVHRLWRVQSFHWIPPPTLTNCMTLGRSLHFWVSVLWTELCLPPNSYVKGLTPHVIVFGDWALREVIKDKWENLKKKRENEIIRMGPWFNRADVLTRRNQKFLCRDSPGGPVVRTLPSNAGGAGLIPGRGAKIPHALPPKNKT